MGQVNQIVFSLPPEANEQLLKVIRKEVQRHLSSPEIQFVRCDDWIGCYVDGILVDQGHSFYAPHLLEILSDHINILVPDTISFTEEQMNALGSNFPDRLEDALEQQV